MAAACPAATRACRKKVLPRNRRPRACRKDARRLHLHLLPVTAGEKKADLGERLAAQRGADPGRPRCAVAEDAGLDRQLVPSRRQHRNQDRRWRQSCTFEGGMTLPTRARFSQRRLQGAGSRHRTIRSPSPTTAATTEKAARCGMQRIGPWLAVVDNSGCGGAGGELHRALSPLEVSRPMTAVADCRGGRGLL